jgi:hypothetical protein
MVHFEGQTVSQNITVRTSELTADGGNMQFNCTILGPGNEMYFGHQATLFIIG